MLWDDENYIVKPETRSLRELWRIWIEIYPGRQAYPLTYSAFWVEHRLWGDDTLGYHLVNITLHAASAFVVMLLLRRLRVPGAHLAAAIFALHPVHVESVAWITELKNTLSGVFYLTAALVYLRFDKQRRWADYAVALVLFALALMTKTVTATLPPALLVVFWWQRGRLAWRRDVAPLLPFMLLGAGAGLFSVWVEHALIGAKGSDFDFTLLERCLIAGRVIWFYLAKVCWPENLVFIYPRWNIDAAVWWQYVFPAGVLALIAALWLLRKRTRAPLAALLFFSGTLFPVLGFFNVYPFRFSFVADHFQYLASLGIISLISCSYATMLSRAKGPIRTLGYAGAVSVIALLWVLTFLQSRTYADAATHWETTITRNPTATMAYVNKAMMYVNNALSLLHEGKRAEAMTQLALAEHTLFRARERGLDHTDIHTDLSLVYQLMGRTDDSLAEAETAIRMGDVNSDAHLNKVFALKALGRTDEAIATCYHALATTPNKFTIYNWLGVLYAETGRPAESIQAFRHAMEIGPKDSYGRPTYIDSMTNLAYVYEQEQKYDEAAELYQRAVEISPERADLYLSLGNSLDQLGRHEEAMTAWHKWIKIAPRQ